MVVQGRRRRIFSAELAGGFFGCDSGVIVRLVGVGGQEWVDGRHGAPGALVGGVIVEVGCTAAGDESGGREGGGGAGILDGSEHKDGGWRPVELVVTAWRYPCPMMMVKSSVCSVLLQLQGRGAYQIQSTPPSAAAGT